MTGNTAIQNRFAGARAKLWIASLDDPNLEIRAQYNPKELQIDKQIKWQPHKGKESRGGEVRRERSKQADLEFNEAPIRSMAVELLFDGYEQGRSIEGEVELLEELSSARNPESANEDERRPHHCVVAWGDSQNGMRPFRCVIESLIIKYTTWNDAGMPLRATCTVKLTEAVKMSGAAESTSYRNRGDSEEDANDYQHGLQERDAARRRETERQIAERGKK